MTLDLHHTMPANPVYPLPALNYNQLRRLWCLHELIRFLKRWGIYIAMTLFLLGTGANADYRAMAALLAWTVYPLLKAAAQPLPIALLATLAHSLIGGAVIFALRPMLWSQAWREAESALPLSRADVRRSDAHVVALALSPVAAVYIMGMVTWLVSGAAWVAPVRRMGLMMVTASLLGSVAWGLGVLQQWRRPVRWATVGKRLGSSVGSRVGSSTATKHITKTPDSIAVRAYRISVIGHFHFIYLVLWPLWRGPARRVGSLVLASLLASVACCAALAHWPAAVGWTLAVYALLSLALTTRLCKLINTDLAPLHDACAPLPIAPRDLLRTRQALALAAPTCALLMIAATGCALRDTLYIAPLLGFVLSSAAFHSVLALTSLARRSGKSQDEAAWWLLALVMVVAFASEVGR